MFRALKSVMCGVGVALFAVACTAVAAETRISSMLQASEFNDLASQYMQRPTFVSIQKFSDGKVALKVLMDEYGTGYDPLLGAATEHATLFDSRFVSSYLTLIDKYLEWEALAKERRDLIEKEIGVAKTWGNASDIDLKFSIYSSKTSEHLLVIERCAFGTCVDKALYFTRPNAQALRSLLSDFAEGRVGLSTVDSIYK